MKQAAEQSNFPGSCTVEFKFSQRPLRKFSALSAFQSFGHFQTTSKKHEPQRSQRNAAEAAEKTKILVPSKIEDMKVLTEYLKFHTRNHREYVHITPQVDAIVKKSGVKEGMVLVSAMHITAGIYVNDNESGLIEDIDQWLEKLAPFNKNYQHHQTGEDNGDSHLKALLIHHEVIVPITAGKLDFGTWQRIFYAEFDGQRDKRVIVKVMGE